MNSQQKNSPIAVVGIGCRLPGMVRSPEDLWKLLINKGDAIIDVPDDRWNHQLFYDKDKEKSGKMYIKQAGFLGHPINEFDPTFFGISPRETPNMDPQQRLLLEVSYEAIEDAGFQMEKLRGRSIGVFMGCFFLDYKIFQLSPLNRNAINMHTPYGATMTLVSNRLSYIFDFKGPSVTMDTACSSSLVAIHYACQSIWNAESEMALVGGVHLMLRPEPLIALSKGGFLSDHSRCKTFDEDARGYVRSEGAGVVLLKPYEKALEDRDTIYALVHASGVNQDGQTKGGISVPNSNAQEALIRKVYSSSGLDINDVSYVEAHGTGTQAGDPAEIRALNAIFSERENSIDKLNVGSIKTNIGHSEAVAGVAGFIKANLILKNKSIPPNLHFNKPNPKLNYESLSLQIPTENTELPLNGKTLVSVNSFGYGGTNAHVILGKIDEKAIQKENSLNQKLNNFKPSLNIVPISGHTDQALKARIKDYSNFIEHEKPELSDFIYTSAYRRSHLVNRLAVVADSNEDLIRKLNDYVNEGIEEGIISNKGYINESSDLVFVYTGMGPQWWAMGRELYHSEPVFKEAMDKINNVFIEITGCSMLDELLKTEEESRMEDTQIAQPCNFLIQSALTELLKFYGVEPNIIVGHSVGEVSSAYASGALSLEDAVKVSFNRGRLQSKLRGTGTMLAVGLGDEDIKSFIGDFTDISIAAINSPTSVTLSGTSENLSKLSILLEEKQIFNRMLQVEVPYHSYFMEEIKDELLNLLVGIKPKDFKIPVYSTVTTEIHEGADWNAEYWWKNVREPVRFAATLNNILKKGYRNFIEIGPHPVLQRSITECMNTAGIKGSLLATLKRKSPEIQTFFESLGGLYTAGIEIDFNRFCEGGKKISLPSYPWQRDTYEWNESYISKQDRMGDQGHRFCVKKINSPNPMFEAELCQALLPYLSDHMVQDAVVLPGAAYVEAGLSLHYSQNDVANPCILENLEFKNMLVINPAKTQYINSSLDPHSGFYTIQTRTDNPDEGWIEHAMGRIARSTFEVAKKSVEFDLLKETCVTPMMIDEFYDKLNGAGLTYYSHFRTVKELSIGDNELLARIQVHDDIIDEVDAYYLHPTLLDGAIQTLAAFFDKLVVPTKIKKIHFYNKPFGSCFSHLKLTEVTNNDITGDIALFSSEGEIFAELRGLQCQRVSHENELVNEKSIDGLLYEESWVESKLNFENTKTGSWLFITEDLNSLNLVLDGFHHRGIENHVKLITEDCSDEKFSSEIGHLINNNSIKNIVYAPNNSNFNSLESYDLNNLISRCMTLVNSVKGIELNASDDQINLQLFTCKSQQVNQDDKGIDLNIAPLASFVKLISNEIPRIKCKLIDVDHDLLNYHFNQLIFELISDNTDIEVAYRNEIRYVKQLHHCDNVESVDIQMNGVESVEPVKLNVHNMITINNEKKYYFECAKRIEPQGKEIEIQVINRTLNVNDKIKVNREIKPDTDQILTEYTGIIKNCGDDQNDFAPGEKVVVLTSNTEIGTYITTEPVVLMKYPQFLVNTPNINLQAFMLAIWALRDVASIKQGEKILIHNACTPKGLAGIQYAKSINAQIYATVESKEQVNYLNTIGIDHVFSVSTIDFVESIERLSDYEGIDIILSDMNSELVTQSMSILSKGGRFVQYQSSLKSDRSLFSFSNLKNNIFISLINPNELFFGNNEICKNLVDEIKLGFERNLYTAIPANMVSVSDVNKLEDFSNFSNPIFGSNTMIDFDNKIIDVAQIAEKSFITQNASYIITGGTKGVGLELAKWLSDLGVAQLVLLSRSGIKTDEAIKAVSDMEKNGTQIYAPKLDVSSLIEVQEMIKYCKKNLPPIKGIIHGAMVLDDGYIKDMTADRFEKVLFPKIKGALNLFYSLKNTKLDFFVSFSSIASLVGNPGQANYIVANSFLENFAVFLRQHDIPGITVNLGVVAGTGVAFRNAGVQEILERTGLRAITLNQITSCLEKLIKDDFSRIGVFDVDWKLWTSNNPESKESSYFNLLISDDNSLELTDLQKENLEILGSLGETDRITHMENLVSNEVARVLRLAEEKVQRNKAFMEQGVDSLMITELKVSIYNSLGVNIAETTFFNYSTVEKLSNYLIKNVLKFEDNFESDDENEPDDELKLFEETMKKMD